MKAIRTGLMLALSAVLFFSVTDQTYAKVYASYVRVTQDSSLTVAFDGNFADRSGAAIRFFLNHQADSVVVNVVPAAGGATVKTLRKANAPQGDNVVMWNGSTNTVGVPAAAGSYKIQIAAYHRGFSTYTEYHLSTPAIFTRGVGSVNNPALRWFGFIYSASNGGYATGVTRHASFGRQWGNKPDSAQLTTTGVAVGPNELRYATTIDQDGYAYIIGRTAGRIYRYHLDTLNVALFDSSAYRTRIQGLDVRGSGASKVLYVTGDTAIFRIPIGTQSFNTIAPTPLVYARATTNGRVMNFWDAKVGQDNSLYATFRVDSAAVRYERGIYKWNLATGTLPKAIADTVWTSRIPDGDPVTLALDDGATAAATDDILYMNTDLATPNTFPSNIYAYANLGTTAPTRSIAWNDPDNNSSVTRSALATDALGNIIYFENSNEQVVLVSPPSGANSYTYTSYSSYAVATPGIAPVLATIAEARIDADGNRQPDRRFDTLKVIGVVNSVNIQTTNFGYFIQDESAGIHIFKSGLTGAPTLRPGYRVQVTGFIDYFRGTTEITPINLATDITILDTGNVVPSIPVTIGQYMANPELYESRRIQLSLAHPYNFTSAQWPAAGSSANLTIWDGRDTTILRVDSDTEIDGSPFPTFPVRLTGVGTQFTTATTNDTTGYQITPMFIADFVPYNAPPISNFRLLTPANGAVIVVDTTATYKFTWRRSVDFNGDPIIYQFKPVLFAGVASDNAGADSVKTFTGAQLVSTYMSGADAVDFRWTVLAKDTPNPPVSSRDTFSVILRRFAPPTNGWSTQTSGVTTALYSVKAVSPTVAWTAGAGGRVLRTTNGGTTWTNVGGGNIGTADIYAIDAVNATTALVTTTPSTTSYLFRTTNAGTTWDTVYVQAGGFLDAIKMYDATNGVAMGDPVGGKWTIIKTTNGGTSWARIATEPLQVGTEAGSNNGMATLGTTNIWFCSNGTTSAVYRTTNGGTSWTSVNLPFTASFTAGIAFNNAQYGVVGANGGQAARTTDGGLTWTSVTIPGTGAIYGAAGFGNDFYVTRGATVAASGNRGQTWTTSYSGSIGTFEHVSVAALGSTVTGWAVTSTGAIAAYYGTLTGVDENGLIPETFQLSQNYPNPFNPSTTIRYALPKDAFVTLRVYNLLGQEVATLKEELQSSGTFSIVWNGRSSAGSQVASGMYFYRIEARPADGSQPFVANKKMLLVK